MRSLIFIVVNRAVALLNIIWSTSAGEGGLYYFMTRKLQALPENQSAVRLVTGRQAFPATPIRTTQCHNKPGISLRLVRLCPQLKEHAAYRVAF